jgi:hypothetical protein
MRLGANPAYACRKRLWVKTRFSLSFLTIDIRPHFLSSSMFNITPPPLSSICNIKCAVRMIPFIFLIYFQACGSDIEDPTPPPPPQWVQKSLPEEWPERGIDAHESSGIYLEWNSDLGEDIVAYNIYRATWNEFNDTLGDYVLVTRIETANTIDQTYVDGEVANRIRYYYKLNSESISGDISDFSDPLSYSLFPQIRVEMMTPNGQSIPLPPSRQLTWNNFYLNETQDFSLTILNMNYEIITRIVLQPRDYFNGNESWKIPIEIIFNSGEVYKWRIEANANYVDGYETGGSESLWAKFIFIANSE